MRDKDELKASVRQLVQRKLPRSAKAAGGFSCISASRNTAFRVTFASAMPSATVNGAS